MVQPYYKSIGDRFMVSYSLSETLAEDYNYMVWQDEVQQRLTDGLRSFGLEFKAEKREKVEELITLIKGLRKRAFEETVDKQGNPNDLGGFIYRSLVKLITNLKLAQDPNYMSALNELNSVLTLQE